MYFVSCKFHAQISSIRNAPTIAQPHWFFFLFTWWTSEGGTYRKITGSNLPQKQAILWNWPKMLNHDANSIRPSSQLKPYYKSTITAVKKVPRKILQEKNPRQNPQTFIQQKSSDTFLQIGWGNRRLFLGFVLKGYSSSTFKCPCFHPFCFSTISGVKKHQEGPNPVFLNPVFQGSSCIHWHLLGFGKKVSFGKGVFSEKSIF